MKERELLIDYHADGFYATWVRKETDQFYLLRVTKNCETVAEKRIDKAAVMPVPVYVPEQLNTEDRYEFALRVVSEEAVTTCNISSGIKLLYGILERIYKRITKDRILVLNQDLVQNEVWTDAWEQFYGKREITILNVQEPKLSVLEERLYLKGDGIQSVFYVERTEGSDPKLCLQFDFGDLQQEMEQRSEQGTLVLADVFKETSGTELFKYTKELGDFSQLNLLQVCSRLYCGRTVQKEICIELGPENASLILWKNKLELQNWSVICRKQTMLREKDTVQISSASIQGEFLIGSEKQAEILVHIGDSDVWSMCLSFGEGDWFVAIAELVGFPKENIEEMVSWLGEKTGDFSLDTAVFTFSVSQNCITGAEFSLKQRKSCDLFHTGLYLKDWNIFINMIKGTEWISAVVLAGELGLGGGEDAPGIFVTVPLQEGCRQVRVSSREKGIALPSFEELLKIAGIGNGEELIPDELYNLNDYRISQLEFVVDFDGQPRLAQYNLEISSQKKLIFAIGNFQIRIHNVSLGIKERDEEGPYIEGSGTLIFQKIECRLCLKVDCTSKALQMSAVLKKDEAEQIQFDVMADGFVDENLRYKNLPLPEGFEVPIFEEAVLWADTGKQKYAVSGKLKNLGTCIFATSLDVQGKMGYILAAVADENFRFAEISGCLAFMDSVFLIRTGGIVLSALTGRRILDVMAEIPPELGIPSGLPQTDSEIKNGLFVYGRLELVAPVFQFLFGLAGEEKPTLETSLYFPEEEGEILVRVGLKEMSLFQLLYFRQLEFFCRIKEGTSYGLNGRVFLAAGGQEYGFEFSISGDTRERKIMLKGSASEPIDLGFLTLTDTVHTKGPAVYLELDQAEKKLGISGEILLFGEPFADIKCFDYEFQKERFLGKITYTGPVALFRGTISFAWNREKGPEILEFPMHFLDEMLDYAKLIEEASSSTQGECKKIAGLIFNKAVRTEFMITPSFGGVDEDGMTAELEVRYIVSAAGTEILTASMNKLIVRIEKPSEIGFEALAGLVVNTVLKNAASIAGQIVEDMGHLAKLIAVMGAVQATEEAFGALLCRGGKELVKSASEVFKAKQYADAAAGGGGLAEVAADAQLAGSSSMAASEGLELAGAFFGALAGISIIGGGSSGKDLEEYKKEVDKKKKEAEAAREDAEKAVIERLEIKELILMQKKADMAELGWRPILAGNSGNVKYHVMIKRSGEVLMEYTGEEHQIQLPLEPGKENFFEVEVYALYQYDSGHIYQGETAELKAKIGKPLAILTTSLPAAVSGAEYKCDLKAEGGSGSYHWKGNGLPEGLEIQDQTICGVPKYGGGEVYVDLVVEDTTGNSIAAGFWLKIT